MCYKPIIVEIKDYFPEPIDPKTGKKISILHPGCGMGRLVFDSLYKATNLRGMSSPTLCFWHQTLSSTTLRRRNNMRFTLLSTTSAI
jgi:hypothetical protein